jgi:hypothetical protein
MADYNGYSLSQPGSMDSKPVRYDSPSSRSEANMKYSANASSSGSGFMDLTSVKEMAILDLVAFVAGVVIAIAVVIFAWNYVVPKVFGYKKIGILDAIALFVLSSALIKCSCMYKAS